MEHRPTVDKTVRASATTNLIVVDADALGVARVAATESVARAVPREAETADRVVRQNPALTICTQSQVHHCMVEFHLVVSSQLLATLHRTDIRLWSIMGIVLLRMQQGSQDIRKFSLGSAESRSPRSSVKDALLV